MAKWEKFEQKLRHGQNDTAIDFEELCTYLQRREWILSSSKGSHRKYKHPLVAAFIEIQKRQDGMAKPYQVRQVNLALDALDAIEEQAAEPKDTKDEI